MKTAAFALLVSFGCSIPLAAGDHFIIVQPGYPGSNAEAGPFLGELAAAIAGAGGPKRLEGEYHNDGTEALKAIERTKPSLGIVSLGFFLAHRAALKLEPLCESRPGDRFYLATKKGQALKLSELDGQSVAGTPFEEREFVSRIVFGGGVADVSRWKVVEKAGFTRGVRDAARGKVHAVLLTERERKSLESLTAGKELEVVHKSEELPTALVVTFGAASDLASQAAKAFQALSASAEGKKVLETMGLESFAAVEPKRLDELSSRYKKAAPVAAAGAGPVGGDSK